MTLGEMLAKLDYDHRSPQPQLVNLRLVTVGTDMNGLPYMSDDIIDVDVDDKQLVLRIPQDSPIV